MHLNDCDHNKQSSRDPFNIISTEKLHQKKKEIMPVNISNKLLIAYL